MRNKKIAWIGKYIGHNLQQFQQPLVEILGYSRILVENYCKVLDYNPDRIRISVCYGEISILGSRLSMSFMTDDQLVISGIIESVSLCRRNVQ